MDRKGREKTNGLSFPPWTELLDSDDGGWGPIACLFDWYFIFGGPGMEEEDERVYLDHHQQQLDHHGGEQARQMTVPSLVGAAPS